MTHDVHSKAKKAVKASKLKFFVSLILVNKKIPPIGLAHLSVPNKNKMSKITEGTRRKLVKMVAGIQK